MHIVHYQKKCDVSFDFLDFLLRPIRILPFPYDKNQIV